MRGAWPYPHLQLDGGSRVYDISGSFVWRNGRHWVRHQAGADLTDALRDAPYGPELLSRYP